MNVIKKKILLGVVLATAIFTTSQVSAIGVAAWGGYNMVLTGSADCSTYTTCSTGGIAAGADLYIAGLGPAQLGLAAAYLPLQSFTNSVTSGTTTLTTDVSAAMLPVLAVARINLPVLPIFVGGGVGYAIGVGSATVNGVSATAAGNSFALGAFAGYMKGLGPVNIEAGFRVHLILADTSSASASGSMLTFTPTVGASIMF